MRILIVTPEYPPHTGGGILRYYHALAPALVRQGCEVTVLVAAPTSADFAERVEDGVRVVPVPIAAVDARESSLAQFSAAPHFRRWLAGALAAHEVARGLGKFDAVEATDFGLGFVPFVLAADGPPVLVEFHGSLGQIADHEPARADRLLDDALVRLAELTTLPAADALQTYATGNAKAWQRRLNRSVEVCPPPLGVRPGSDTGQTGVRHGSESANRAGLVIGRIQSWKGPAVLCRALEQLPHLEPIEWVGRDTATAPDGGSLSESLAHEFPTVWGQRVRPIGPRAYDDVQRRIQTARFVVVPSHWDVFNLTAVEAMAAGRIVICSSGAGASDLIEPGVNGFVFDAGEATELASALTVVSTLSDVEVHRIGEAARDTVSRTLDPGTIAAARIDRYASLRGARRNRPADWVGETFTGERSGAGTEFLDQLAVSDLSKYLGRRLRAGITTRVFKRA